MCVLSASIVATGAFHKRSGRRSVASGRLIEPRTGLLDATFLRDRSEVSCDLEGLSQLAIDLTTGTAERNEERRPQPS